MLNGSSVYSEDEELFIDVEEVQQHPCYRGFTPLTTGGGGGVLSLQAMVDAVVHYPVDSPSSSSAMSSRSVVVASSTTSSPRCSPVPCRYRQDSDDARPASSPSPASEKTKTLTRRSNSDCCEAAGRRRLPDVVQLPSVVCAAPRHRRSFLIEEILRPDFGRRRPPAALIISPQKQLPAEVGDVNHHVTSIWQPFAASPLRTGTVDAGVCRQDIKELGELPRNTTTKTSGDRMRKSAKRKSQAGDVGSGLNCSAAADESTTRQHVALAGRSSSPSSSTASSSSSSSSGSGSDVTAVRTDSSTSVTSSESAVPQSKFGQLALPAWVYCTRYSDRPSSGVYASPFINFL